jgi:hypothetical protein
VTQFVLCGCTLPPPSSTDPPPTLHLGMLTVACLDGPQTMVRACAHCCRVCVLDRSAGHLLVPPNVFTRWLLCVCACAYARTPTHAGGCTVAEPDLCYEWYVRPAPGLLRVEAVPLKLVPVGFSRAQVKVSHRQSPCTLPWGIFTLLPRPPPPTPLPPTSDAHV